MSNKTKIILASALVVVLLAAGAGGAVALAQGPTPTPPGGKAGIGQLYLQSLASRLGTTLDKLQQAMKDARTDATNNAVKQGLITQAQADKMLQRQQNAQPGARGFQAGKPVERARGFFGADALEAAAKALNMSPAEVTTALRGGKTLADLAKSQKVDPSTVQSAIADAEKSALDRAAKDGLISQDRANTLKSNIDPSKIDLSRPRAGKFGGQPKPTPTRKP